MLVKECCTKAILKAGRKVKGAPRLLIAHEADAPRAGSPTGCHPWPLASHCAPNSQSANPERERGLFCITNNSPKNTTQHMRGISGNGAPVHNAPPRRHPLHAAWPDDALQCRRTAGFRGSKGNP